MEVLRVTPNLPNCALIAESVLIRHKKTSNNIHSQSLLILAIKSLSATEQRDCVIAGGRLCLVCD